MNSAHNSPPLESHEFSSQQPTAEVTLIQLTTAHSWSHINSAHYSPPLESHEFSYYPLHDCMDQSRSEDANINSASTEILSVLRS